MHESPHVIHVEAPINRSTRDTNPSLLPLAGVAVYLATSIIYMFESGSPQPADFALMLAIMATVTCVWRRYPGEPLLYFAAATFVIWILLVNSVWYLGNGDPKFLRKTMFYFYNMIAFLFVVSLCYHDFKRVKIVIYWALIVALVLQIGMLIFFSTGNLRSTGTFNNPNQLGYWGLLVLACFGIIKEREPLSLIDIGVLAGAGYVVIRSLSKAASLSSGLIILSIVFFCGWRRGAGLLLGALLVVGTVAEVASGGYFGIIDRVLSTQSIANLDQRISSIGEQDDDDIFSRGYYRIFDNPELMILGAGEGDFSRLDAGGDAKEFHSTLGNLLVSYGLVGIGFFLFLLVVVFQRAPLPSLAYFAPLMLYGITHNGIRSSLLWFFLALVYAQAAYGDNRRSNASPSQLE